MAATRNDGGRSRIRAMRMLVDKGAERYDRDRHLPRLIGKHTAGRDERNADSAAAIAALKRALRSQRRLARAGHWSYDLNRHFGLLQALKAERARIRRHAVADSGETSATSATAGMTETGTATS